MSSIALRLMRRRVETVSVTAQMRATRVPEPLHMQWLWTHISQSRLRYQWRGRSPERRDPLAALPQ